MSERNREEWRRVIAEYRSSKETVNTFCIRHKINSSTLYYQLAKEKESQPGPVKILPVVSPIKKPGSNVELLLQRGMSLRFSPDASAHYVADIIKALGQV